ncbi:M48 family metalloprotease [Lentilactobacillus kribbianus]|uniref:M48 family metalloprotease n=1 Tax=Lentilactobacillus kribbianus TaxID=2729622 RepID=UPI001551A77E
MAKLDTLGAQVSANKRRSAWTIALFLLLINVIFFVVAYVLTSGDMVTVAQVMIWLEVFLVLYILYRYWQGGQEIIRMNKGQEIFENSPNEQYRQVYNIVTELSIASGMPMPRVYVVPDNSPNAFATGMSPNKASVSVTQGLLDIMNREELEGVIAHEMSHVKNYDIRVTTLSIALVGFISLMGYGLMRVGQSMSYYRSSDEKDNTSAYFGIAMMALGGIILVVGLPISYLLEKVLSRKRESLADVSGSELTGNPQGLISALEKLQGPQPAANVLSPQAAGLYLVEPLFGKEHKRSWWSRMMDDHPPLDERIAALKRVLGESDDSQ